MRHFPTFTEARDPSDIGNTIYRLASEIYPFCRSITGSGVRDTLTFLSRHIDLTIHSVPTGTQVFDWQIPKEWTIRDAFIKNSAGVRVVDFKKSNLHVLNYSTPVHVRLHLSELKRHIFTLPEQPDLIPYRTSYYQERWGFCMAHRDLEALPDGIYEAVIDSSLEDGHLEYGEFLHEGTSSEEFLLSAHICHPSLANDNCSGLALLTHVANRISSLKTRYSYRFLFAPGTIGAIAWLSHHEAHVGRIKHGLVLSCVGDGGGPTYKRSRQGHAIIDRAMCHILRHDWPAAKVVDFSPYGYDERQFCSPGFNLPVGLLQRSQFGAFPEYHTSADNLDFIRPEHLASSYALVMRTIELVENNRRPLNLLPKCEPQLGRRGLFSTFGGDPDGPAKSMALLWVLNLADGEHCLLDIAERADMPFGLIAEAAARLHERELITYLDGA
jgi:aminopeptidase-like protein